MKYYQAIFSLVICGTPTKNCCAECFKGIAWHCQRFRLSDWWWGGRVRVEKLTWMWTQPSPWIFLSPCPCVPRHICTLTSAIGAWPPIPCPVSRKRSHRTQPCPTDFPVPWSCPFLEVGLRFQKDQDKHSSDSFHGSSMRSLRLLSLQLCWRFVNVSVGKNF